MDINELERQGVIRKLPVNKKKVFDSLDLAKRDLATAKDLLDNNTDWAFSIAYNSILQSVRALMFSKGYRPSSNAGHISAVQFAKIFLHEDDVIPFDRMRRKRHAAVYDTVGTISKTEVGNAISRAEKIITTIEKLIDEDINND